MCVSPYCHSADVALVLWLARNMRVSTASRTELALTRKHDVPATNSAFISCNLHKPLFNAQGERPEAAAADAEFVSGPTGCLRFAPACWLASVLVSL